MNELNDKHLSMIVAGQSGITADGLALARVVLREWGMPTHGINILGSKTGPRVYINNIGLTWLTHKQAKVHGGLRLMASEMLEDARMDKETWKSRYRGIIEFGDGARFEADGFASKNSAGMANPDAMNHLAETRAMNRAMRRATSCSLTSVEEMDPRDPTVQAVWTEKGD